MSEQTPIPAEALEAAAKVAFRRYQNEYTVSPNLTWRDFVAEIHEFVEVVAPILLAAGRTAAAADALNKIAREVVGVNAVLVHDAEQLPWGPIRRALIEGADQ